MTQFEDIPSVMDVLVRLEPTHQHKPGDVIATTNAASDEIGTRGKYLVIALSENDRARALASEYEMIYVEGDYGLYLHGDESACNEYMLACWPVPEIRRLFETLGLRVVT